MLQRGRKKVRFTPVDNDEEKKRILKDLLANKPGRATDETTTFLLTPAEFSKVFSPERLKLLRLVSKEPKLSVTELAGILKRKREAVSRDMRFFEGLGLIKLEKKSREKRPSRVIEEISISL